MISMNCLGVLGRLGNQMFQYAALRSLAKKFNYEYVLSDNNKQANEDLTLFDCFKLDNERRSNTNLYKIRSSTFGFDSDIFNKCPDNVDLQGYFQDIKYFRDNQNDIRRCYTFQDNIFEKANYIFNSLFSNREVIAVHIRRKDYCTYPGVFPVQTIDYYSQALSTFAEDINVLVFSDDHQFTFHQDLFKGNRFFFATNNSNAVDLCLQTLCKYHIIANSTFSWWAAWLANSEKVVRPKKWLGPNLPGYENFLVVDGWTEM